MPRGQEEKKQSRYPSQLFIEREGGMEGVQGGEVAWGTRAVGPGEDLGLPPGGPSRLAVRLSREGRGGAVSVSLQLSWNAP